MRRTVDLRGRKSQEAFAGNLQACINICGPDEILIMGIDANASLGTRSAHDKKKGRRRKWKKSRENSIFIIFIFIFFVCCG